MATNNALSSGLDYTIDSIDDRMKKVDQIIEQHDSELVSYFDEYYNPSLKQSSNLSEQDRMCRQLERMADYLLYADNKEKRNQNHEELHIVSNNDDDKNKKKEVLSNELTSIEESGKKVIHQHKLYRKVKVTKEDREQYPELADTGRLIERLNKLINTGIDSKGNPIDKDEMKKLKWYRIEIQKDEVAMKEMLKGYIRFKRLSPESADEDFSRFNFTDIEQVKILFEHYSKLKENSFDDTHGDLKIILEVFEQLVDNTDFPDYMFDIFVMKIDGLSRKSIVKNILEKHSVSISESRVSQITKTVIPEMIIDTYKRSFEDWVFTFMQKGTYKECNKCKQNKLMKHFGRNSRARDGLHSTCKDCRK